MTDKQQMKACVFLEPEKVEFQTVSIPQIKPDEILLKVGAAAICGTDVRIYLGKKTKGVRSNSILGHEFSGQAVEVGSEVKEFKAGDRLAVAPVIACGECYYCQHGRPNVCANRVAIGYEFDGGFAEYVKLPAVAIQAGNVFSISPRLPIEEAALLEPLSCCICGQRKQPIEEGDTLLIVGAGPIGLLHQKLAQLIPGTTIIVSDPTPDRLEMSQRIGAASVVDPNESDLYEAVLNQTQGLGVDKVILAASVPELIGDLLKCIRKGGGINLFAGTGIATLDANNIHYNEITVVGSSASTIDDFSRAIDLLENREIEVGDLITHSFELSQFNTAIEHVRAGYGLKTLFQRRA